MHELIKFLASAVKHRYVWTTRNYRQVDLMRFNTRVPLYDLRVRAHGVLTSPPLYTYSPALNLRNDKLAFPSSLYLEVARLKCAFSMKFDAIPISARFRGRNANIVVLRNEARERSPASKINSFVSVAGASLAPRGTIKSRSAILRRT